MIRTMYRAHVDRRTAWAVTMLGAAALLAALIAASAGSAAPAAACSFCGKNLSRTPVPRRARARTRRARSGTCPHWTNAAGQFGAAAYTGFGVGWFNADVEGPEGQGEELLLRRHDDRRDRRQGERSGTQTIKLPAGGSRPQGDAERLARELQREHRAGARRVPGRLGQDAGRDPDRARTRRSAATDMAFRSRTGTVPAGAVSVDDHDHVHRSRELQPRRRRRHLARSSSEARLAGARNQSEAARLGHRASPCRGRRARKAPAPRGRGRIASSAERPVVETLLGRLDRRADPAEERVGEAEDGGRVLGSPGARADRREREQAPGDVLLVRRARSTSVERLDEQRAGPRSSTVPVRSRPRRGCRERARRLPRRPPREAAQGSAGTDPPRPRAPLARARRPRGCSSRGRSAGRRRGTRQRRCTRRACLGRRSSSPSACRIAPRLLRVRTIPGSSPSSR